jgi:hypothetical protein
LDIKGVRCALEISNKRGAKILSLEEACQSIDFEVLYERTDWNNDVIQDRLQTAEKYELLVPKVVPLALISGL